MSYRAPRLWLFAVFGTPFALGHGGCHRTVDEVDSRDQVNDISETDGAGSENDTREEDGSSKRPAELELCDSCDGPAPGAPNYECKDGSVGGPVCAKNDLDECSWLFRACPEEDGDSGDAPGTCENGDCGDFCGGIAGIACGKGEYCLFDESCGAADQGGQCAAIPEACSFEYSPVCGCDGATYSNPCSAASKGVSVAHDGACDSDPQPCSSCAGPMPAAPSVQCKDGNIAGPSCVYDEKQGACGWIITECPIVRDPCQGFECKPGYHCSAPADAPSCVPDVTTCGDGAPLKAGKCWEDSDCKNGSVCKGASCCPAGSQCFAPDRPGTCG